MIVAVATVRVILARLPRANLNASVDGKAIELARKGTVAVFRCHSDLEPDAAWAVRLFDHRVDLVDLSLGSRFFDWRFQLVAPFIFRNRDRSFSASDRQHCIGRATWCDDPGGGWVGLELRYVAVTNVKFALVRCREDRRRRAAERRAAGIVDELSPSWFDNDRAAMHGFGHLIGWQIEVEEIL